MPLSRATPRKLLHQRDIQLRGYERADGLVDIEARILDTKTYSWGNQDRSGIQAGEALHDMWVRVTIDHHMVIQACEASMDATPYNVCGGAAASFGRLNGMKLGKGFIKAAMEQLGGVASCTHLRELLQPIATVAFQTMHSIREHRALHNASKAPRTTSGIQVALLNTCFAYDETGPLARRAAAKASI
ncbi:hypothetical protein GCM10010909_35690 [Acidocella aquatica]|uniref:DUF2889 domain-containing protein n=1 Tax=Acidocella aquatica TaxID=1922313 RepID=A0ABQ6AE15_9PROT|nr:DUF2889 domain-containing protein [Acidocella aquatica]GLR68887.1 hypothetical protein GCM10010909_35690 [Acidocella aquatica]